MICVLPFWQSNSRTGGNTNNQSQIGMEKRNKNHIQRNGKRDTGNWSGWHNFVIAEKRHPLFQREGDDLELVVEVPLVKSLTGCTISIPLLGGEKMNLTIKDIIQPGCENIILGLGMPKSKEEGNRGNLRIEFLVQFPTELTHQQRATVISILQVSCW